MDLFHGEDQGMIHHAVNQQTMLSRIDFGDPGVVTLEME